MAAQTRRGILFVVVETSRMVIPFTTPVTAPHLDTDPRQAIHTFVNCTQSIKKRSKQSNHSLDQTEPPKLIDHRQTEDGCGSEFRFHLRPCTRVHTASSLLGLQEEVKGGERIQLCINCFSHSLSLYPVGTSSIRCRAVTKQREDTSPPATGFVCSCTTSMLFW